MSKGRNLYRQLERDFNIARAIPVARASLGLMAVLRSWVQAGNCRRVAVSAAVCQDVIAAVLGANCELVFCDVNYVDGIVPDREWIKARSAGASVAIVVHLYGNPVEVSKVRNHFPSPECLIIDDAAQALGSYSSFGLVGGQGDVGLLSFGATKHIESGGAAVLFKDYLFAEAVAHTLTSIEIVPEVERKKIQTSFRKRFEIARGRLLIDGDDGAIAFNDLLTGYYPSLQLPFPSCSDAAVCIALDTYSQAMEQRLQKSAAWVAGTEGCGLVPVGMGEGTVPWRYTCRLPGIDWLSQYRLGEEIRSHGIDVSNWYLPAHWMCGYVSGTLPGVEQLAREVFQFWVDTHTSLEAIERGVEVVVAIIESFYSLKMGTK